MDAYEAYLACRAAEEHEREAWVGRSFMYVSPSTGRESGPYVVKSYDARRNGYYLNFHDGGTWEGTAPGQNNAVPVSEVRFL